MKFSMSQYCANQGWNEQPNEALDSESTLVIIFGASRNNDVHKALDELIIKFPNSIIIGCSSSGQIYGETVNDDTLSVAILKFDKVRLKPAFSTISGPEESSFAGQHIGSQLNAQDLKAVFVLCDGTHVNGSSLVSGLNAMLGNNVVITGGIAGDGDQFEKTWIINNQGRHDKGIIAVGFYGDALNIAHGSRGGWKVVKSGLHVTHAINNVIYELDDQPALEVYKSLLGEQAKNLPSSGLLYPLAIENEDELDGVTVRTILSIDEEQNSITFAGDIPDDTMVDLMEAEFGDLVLGAEMASSDATSMLDNQAPIVNLAISCVGRRLLLKDRTADELKVVAQMLPPESGQIGFYSYGEISPLVSGRCSLHNQTMTITLFGED